jgi:circadian clock protein KaiC
MHRANDTAERLPTGVCGLDSVLFGGFLRHNVILVEGGPGTGKSILGWHFLHQGATVYNEPGLLITFELSPKKLLDNARRFGWDFEQLEANKKAHLIFTTPSILGEEMQSPDGVLAEEIIQIGAKRVFIDGLSPLRGFSERYSGRPFRESLYQLLESLQRFGVTVMLTQETTDLCGVEGLDERFMCDTILQLAREQSNNQQSRWLQVVKARGQQCLEGRHTLCIEAGRGACVYPRAEALPTCHQAARTGLQARDTTGVIGLDACLGGGFVRGGQCLVVGPRGAGKTALGLHFLSANASRGSRPIWVTHSGLWHAQQTLGHLGLPPFLPDENIVVLDDVRDPSIPLDAQFSRLRDLVCAQGNCCLAIDDLNCDPTSMHPVRREFIRAIERLARTAGATALYLQRGDSAFADGQALVAQAHLGQADYVALLTLERGQQGWERALTWPKACATPPVGPKPFIVTPGSVTLTSNSPAERVQALALNQSIAPESALSTSPALDSAGSVGTAHASRPGHAVSRPRPIE